jgi:hypothetical protein
MFMGVVFIWDGSKWTNYKILGSQSHLDGQTWMESVKSVEQQEERAIFCDEEGSSCEHGGNTFMLQIRLM